MKIYFITAMFLVFSLTALPQANKRLVKVQGNAIFQAIPELMLVNITLSAKDSVYSVCSDVLIDSYNALEKDFIKAGIEKENLKSDEISIGEDSRRLPGGEREKVGYSGSVSITLKLPHTPKLLNTVINTLSNGKHNASYYLRFKLSNKQKDDLLKDAIELAVKDAHTKAMHIANSLKVKLLEVKEVNFGYTSFNGDRLTPRIVAFGEQRKGGDALDLNPQSIGVQKTIGIVWAIGANQP
jgi:uncharacterized protein YggE